MFMVFHYLMHVLTIIIITSRICGHVGGHAYSVSVSKWLLDWHIQPPIIFVECTLGVGTVLYSKTC